MPELRGRSATLSRIVAIRVLLFASLAMALQAASIFITHYFDDQQLGSMMVELEANGLLSITRRGQGKTNIYELNLKPRKH